MSDELEFKSEIYWLSELISFVHNGNGNDSFAYYNPHDMKKARQDAIRAVERLRDERNRFRLENHWLGKLLACFHGDGGHYQEEHGMKKATEDAISAYCEGIGALDELRAERDRYRAVLERIGRQWKPSRERDLARLAIAEADKDKPHD